jgi:phosphatidylserine decarboxylase
MEADAPITLLNRHTGRMETEQVYGEKWLRRIYGNPLGKLTLHTVVKRALFSKLYGWAMDRPSSARRVAPFVKAFGLDPAEFADSDLNSYRTFNDFFYRKLKDSARPVDPRAEMAVLPADGRHLGFPDASRVNGIFAKGQTFDMAALVADRALGERYARGTVVCSRLCPVDYHRFHFPVAGVPGQPVLAQGQLYSVNPIALRRSAAYLWQNKRQRVTIDAGPFGLVTCSRGFVLSSPRRRPPSTLARRRTNRRRPNASRPPVRLISRAGSGSTSTAPWPKRRLGRA